MHELAPIPSAKPGYARRWNIATQMVTEATKHLPDSSRGPLRWLQDYGLRSNITRDDVAKLLKRPDGTSYDGNTVYQELTGRREKPSPQFIIAIKSLMEAKAKSDDGEEEDPFPFTMDSFAADVFQCCELAREEQTMVFFWCESHKGKTRPAKEYAKIENAKVFGSVVYVRMPTKGHLAAFTVRTGKALGISGNYKTAELRELIIEWFQKNPDVLFIVDESSQCFIGTTAKAVRVETFEFIREIHDMSRRGVFLIGTNEVGDGIEKGPYAGIFKQLTNRGLLMVRHSGKRSQEDYDLYAASVNLPAPTGEALKRQQDILERDSHGTWLKLLLRAQKRAKRLGETFAWSHVIHVDNVRAKLRNRK